MFFFLGGEHSGWEKDRGTPKIHYHTYCKHFTSDDIKVSPVSLGMGPKNVTSKELPPYSLSSLSRLSLRNLLKRTQLSQFWTRLESENVSDKVNFISKILTSTLIKVCVCDIEMNDLNTDCNDEQTDASWKICVTKWGHYIALQIRNASFNRLSKKLIRSGYLLGPHCHVSPRRLLLKKYQ